MYATNVVNLLKLMLKDGAVAINLDDEIIRETLVTHRGKVVNPRVGALLTQPALTQPALTHEVASS
jgi:NAD(P) transhydrogenase subunit alpha